MWARKTAPLLLLVVGLASAGCYPHAATSSSSGDPDCPVGVAQFQNQRPDVFTSPVECGDFGEQWSGSYLGYFGTDKVLVNAHWLYPDAEWYRSVVAHELGHAWDVKHLTPAQHERFAEIREREWWIEDYADVFALVVGHATHTGYRTDYPPASQVDAICTEGLMPC